MRKLNLIIIVSSIICLHSCSNSPLDKAEAAVQEYLETNLKNPDSYESIAFTSFEELKADPETGSKPTAHYLIKHIYSVVNSKDEEVKLKVSFFLNKDFTVKKTGTKSINGEYGGLAGNVFWKYNDYVGNKPDSGSEITLISLDSLRAGTKFETTADLQGNYKLDNVLSGSYLLVIRSKNTTDCPDDLLFNLVNNSYELNEAFGFDIEKYRSKIDEIEELQNEEDKIRDEFPRNGTVAQMTANIAKTDAIKQKRTDKIEKLVSSFPEDFKSKLGIYGLYNKSIDFSFILIGEGKTENNISDFGITCI